MRPYFKNQLSTIGLILIAIFCFFGCGRQDESRKIDLNKVEEASDLRQEDLGLRVGLVPEEDIRNMALRFEPLAKYLGKKLNQKVTLIYLDSYSEVCDKFIYNQLDTAFFGSFSYALTHAKAGIEPLARPDYQGTSTYRGLIIVRKDSGIKGAAEMKNKRLALVHRATYAGYLYPLNYLKRNNVSAPETYFSKVIFAASHDKAVFDVLYGRADIAAAKDLVYRRMIKENPALEKQLIVLITSLPVPSNTLCVRKDLDPGLRQKLKHTLLNLDNDPEAGAVLKALGAGKFIETKDDDYSNLYQVIKELDIDLNTYPYYDRPDMGFRAN